MPGYVERLARIAKEIEVAKESIAVLLTLIVALVLGCNNSNGSGSGVRSVVTVADDDPEMVAAIKDAKGTLGFFEKNWKTMKSDGYSLKFALPTTEGGLEHIWFSPTKIQDDKIVGVCANEPGKIAGLKLGDTRTVSRNDISDWMIVVGTQCYGGYTIRVLAKRDPAAAPPLSFLDPPKN